MPYRTESFDKFLSEQLQEPDMAREFLLANMEEISDMPGLSLLEALKHTISAMGIKEFSSMSGIHRNSISRMLSQKEIPKIETLNKYLAAFGLTSKLIAIPSDAA